MVVKQAKCAPDLWLGNPLHSPEPEFVPVPPRAGSQGSPRGSPWLSLYDTVWPLEKILTFSLSLFFFSFFFSPLAVLLEIQGPSQFFSPHLSITGIVQNLEWTTNRQMALCIARKRNSVMREIKFI